METNSILNTFWPLMKFLQFLGSCPIKKSTENPCGFKAMSFGCYFSISITIFLLGMTGIIMALTYIMLMFEKTVLELFQIFFGSKGLSTDTVAQCTLYFLMTTMHMINIKVGLFQDFFCADWLNLLDTLIFKSTFFSEKRQRFIFYHYI